MQESKRFVALLALLLLAVTIPLGICRSGGVAPTGSQADQASSDLQSSDRLSVSELGTQLILDPPFSAPDYGWQIANGTYDVRVNRNRTYYFAVTKVEGDGHTLRVYTNDSNPANSNWTLFATLTNPNANLADADVMALVEVNKLYVIYTVGGTAVEILGCRLTDPSNSAFGTIRTGTALSSCSITWGGTPTNPNLYVCWKEGSSAMFAASPNDGYNWILATVASTGVAEMYAGNSIGYCTSGMYICVYFRNINNQGIVGRSLTIPLSFTTTTALSNTVQAGGIACFSSYAVVTGTQGSNQDHNVVFAYSSNNALNWSSPYVWDEPFDNVYPSVASSSSGYFSVLYTTIGWLTGEGTMVAKRCLYSYLGGTWDSTPMNVGGWDNAPCSACLGEGSVDPNYGGAFTFASSSGKSTYFGWAGNLAGDNAGSSGQTSRETFGSLASSNSTDRGAALHSSPTPFNSSTTISFSLPEAGQVRLAVYDLAGRLVATLANGYYTAGSHQVEFQPANMAAGVYLYCLEAGQTHLTQKTVYLK